MVYGYWGVDATQLHGPWIAMLASLTLVLVLAAPTRALRRSAGIALLLAYAVIVGAVLARA